MASMQFSGGKCHGAGEAKAMMRHADRDERLRHDHSNEDIDKAKTCLNTDIFGLSYQEMCRRYDSLIGYLGEQASRAIRKDAVTLYDAIITVPRDLTAEQEDNWYRDVARIIDEHYKMPVVLDIKIHRDEIHEYTDPATKKKVMSRTHGHCFMFPVWKNRLNAKQFSSRANMRSLNREIDEMTREKYHCQFLTGEQAVDRGYQTVEQLKRSSDIAEMLRQAEELADQIARATQERDTLAESAQEAQERTLSLQHYQDIISEQIDGLADRYNALSAQIRRAEDKRNKVYGEVKAIKQEAKQEAYEEVRAIKQDAEQEARWYRQKVEEAKQEIEQAKQEAQKKLSVSDTFELGRLRKENDRYRKRWEMLEIKDPSLARSIEEQARHRTAPKHDRHR